MGTTTEDPWYWFAHDERWRIVATFRDTDTTAKERFVWHSAGLDGHGGSSYIDSVILRDKDTSPAWTANADVTGVVFSTLLPIAVERVSKRWLATALLTLICSALVHAASYASGLHWLLRVSGGWDAVNARMKHPSLPERDVRRHWACTVISTTIERADDIMDVPPDSAEFFGVHKAQADTGWFSDTTVDLPQHASEYTEPSFFVSIGFPFRFVCGGAHFSPSGEYNYTQFPGSTVGFKYGRRGMRVVNAIAVQLPTGGGTLYTIAPTRVAIFGVLANTMTIFLCFTFIRIGILCIHLYVAFVRWGNRLCPACKYPLMTMQCPECGFGTARSSERDLLS